MTTVQSFFYALLKKEKGYKRYTQRLYRLFNHLIL